MSYDNKKSFKKKESDLIPIGSFWDKETKAGDWYGSGALSKDAFAGLNLDEVLANPQEYSLKLFKVKEEYKKGDNSPSLRLYISKKDPKYAGKKGFTPAKSKPAVEDDQENGEVEERGQAPSSKKSPWED